MTTEPDVFDAIHDEFDAVPAETWTDDEAFRVLAVLVGIRHARNGTARPSCRFAGRRAHG
jgi:hypothetical protein